MSDTPDFANQLMDSLRRFFGGPPKVPPPPEPTKGKSSAKTGPVASKQTLPLEPKALTAEEKLAESKKRMGFIIAYMKAPTSMPEFQDPRFVYRIVTDERSFQTELVEQLQAQIKAISLGVKGNPNSQDLLDERAELERHLDSARERLSQLFLILKRVTGTKGKTGGTDFLPSSDEGA